MFRCSSCGGNLVFDIPSQKLRCLYCDESFPVDGYADKDARESAGLSPDEYEVTVYTCTQCGAELTGPENAAVGFCTYCGTEAVLRSRVSKEKKPRKIIPFRKTKEDVAQAYMAKIKKEPYLPKEFKDPSFLEKFRGIYIPYWEYHVGFEGETSLTVQEDYSSGNYTYHKTYDSKADLSKAKVTLTADGSRSFDDGIAKNIAPYNEKNAKTFREGYLAGFFADTADVDPAVYGHQARDLAEEQAIKKIRSGFRREAVIKDLPKAGEERSAALGTKVEGCSVAMYPVWFLTWRGGKRVAYGVANGETGKISAEVPVDTKKFFLVSLIASVVLFGLLELANVLILPPTMMSVSLAAAFLTQIFLLRELKAIASKERHEYDPGFFETEKAIQVAKKGIRSKVSGKGCLVTILVIVAFVMVGVFFLDEDPYEGAFVAGSVFLFLGTVWGVRSVVAAFRVKEKWMIPVAVLTPAAMIACGLLAREEVAEDWLYYGGSIVCLAAVFVTALSMILIYNRLTTRSLPDFHERRGGVDYVDNQ